MGAGSRRAVAIVTRIASATKIVSMSSIEHMRPVFLRSIALSLLLGAMVLLGCDSQKISELREGVSTEADVRSRFGEPAAVYDDGDGHKTLEYPRQPAGQVNYMISIGPDGKMSALRQVLKRSTFARVTPGLDKKQVRRLLGLPASTQSYASKDQEVWDWRFADGPEVKIFSVTFDRDGKVVETGTTFFSKERGG